MRIATVCIRPTSSRCSGATAWWSRAACLSCALRAGESVIVPDGTVGTGYPTMRFATDLDAGDSAEEHRDLAAMILTIELYGDASTAILDQIDDRYRTDGAYDASTGKKVLTQYLDRDGVVDEFDPAEDHQIRYIVDDWGLPLSYLAQCDYKPNKSVASSNYPEWNRASTQMVQLNGGVPIIMSYGSDGKQQCTQEMMGATALVSSVADWEGDAPGSTPDKIDHPLNADNVYVDSGLAEKLAKGK